MTKTFNKVCAQGDVMIIRIDRAPDLTDYQEVPHENGRVIVTHSETGHHHVLDRPSGKMFTHKDDRLKSFLVLSETTNLVHLRENHTHESITMPPGNYKVIRQREYTPEGYRQVQD